MQEPYPPPPLLPPSPTHSASSVVLLLPLTLDSPATAQPAGKGAARQGQEGAVAAGTGEGGGRGGQGEARVGPAAVEAAGAGGKGGATGGAQGPGPRADAFNLAEGDKPGVSVSANILEVSDEEEEVAGRMVLAGGQRQPAAPDAPGAAMKMIVPAVHRKEKGKGRRELPGTGVTGHVGTSRRTGGQRRPGIGGEGQAGVPGARRTAGHQGGAGGKEHQWPQPQQSVRQPPPGSLPQVSAAVSEEKQREARYEALVHLEHQSRCGQAPPPEPKTIYQLEMEVGRGAGESKGKTKGAGGRRGSQPSGGQRVGEGKAGRSGPWTHGGVSRGHTEGQAPGEGEGRQEDRDGAKAGHHGQQ